MDVVESAMINPTVIADNHNGWLTFKVTYPKKYFVLCKEAFGGWYLAAGEISESGDNHTSWYIQFNDDKIIYKIAYQPVSKEKMLYFIQKNHPEQFEWIIWNLNIIIY